MTEEIRVAITLSSLGKRKMSYPKNRKRRRTKEEMVKEIQHLVDSIISGKMSTVKYSGRELIAALKIIYSDKFEMKSSMDNLISEIYENIRKHSNQNYSIREYFETIPLRSKEIYQIKEPSSEETITIYSNVVNRDSLRFMNSSKVIFSISTLMTSNHHLRADSLNIPAKSFSLFGNSSSMIIYSKDKDIYFKMNIATYSVALYPGDYFLMWKDLPKNSYLDTSLSDGRCNGHKKLEISTSTTSEIFSEGYVNLKVIKY